MRNHGLYEDLQHVLNYHSQEQGSDTPDFILAEYLMDCLEVWNRTIERREEWWGRQLKKGQSTLIKEGEDGN